MEASPCSQRTLRIKASSRPAVMTLSNGGQEIEKRKVSTKRSHLRSSLKSSPLPSVSTVISTAHVHRQQLQHQNPWLRSSSVVNKSERIKTFRENKKYDPGLQLGSFSQSQKEGHEFIRKCCELVWLISQFKAVPGVGWEKKNTTSPIKSTPSSPLQNFLTGYSIPRKTRAQGKSEINSFEAVESKWGMNIAPKIERIRLPKSSLNTGTEEKPKGYKTEWIK